MELNYSFSLVIYLFGYLTGLILWSLFFSQCVTSNVSAQGFSPCFLSFYGFLGFTLHPHKPLVGQGLCLRSLSFPIGWVFVLEAVFTVWWIYYINPAFSQGPVANRFSLWSVSERAALGIRIVSQTAQIWVHLVF